MLADRLEGLYEYFYKLSALCSIMMCKYVYMVFIELNGPLLVTVYWAYILNALIVMK